jgi:radical SAM superfamily enzyme YgiQ (UPF0313 family)
MSLDSGLRTPARAHANGKPRVLLINPRITSRRHARFPLSIMTLAAALADRYDATLIDGNLDADAARTVRDAVRAQHFAAVGVTVMGGPQVATAIEVSRAARTEEKALPIVWGGYFPTLYPATALNSDYVDFVARGQGEDTIAELLSALANPGRDGLAQIEGLSWRREDAVVTTKARVHAPAHRADAAL